MHRLARLDHAHVWHPFTQMRDWLRREPIVITHGRGAVLRDARGREYLDANASIWTNLHGHNHPRINAAIRAQLRKIAHVSALGLANEPAALLAERLIRSSEFGERSSELGVRSSEFGDEGATGDARSNNPVSHLPSPVSHSCHPRLSRVFYSDDGSTAVEVALKMAYEVARRSGRSRRPKFISLSRAYHGDTMGAVSLGHIDLFHKAFAGLTFKSDEVMAPYCYRCPFNRAKPERADAREYRRCNWECVGKVEQAFERKKRRGDSYAGFVFEPRIQGAAGMIPQPAGWLRQAAAIARGHGSLLVADEIMTGFGRAGGGREERGVRRGERGKTEGGGWESGKDNRASRFEEQALIAHLPSASPALLSSLSSLRAPADTRQASFEFACHSEGVQPDLMCLAKGLTGGYLPMAATLTTDEVFEAFLGEYEEFKTLFHGHSYTANPLGAAAALASLEILNTPASRRARARLESSLEQELKSLWDLPHVGDVRQVGLVAGIELVRDWRTREPYDLREQVGIRVCEAMARRGVLTRPIGNVIVLMPPYCTTADQVERMVDVLRRSIRQVLG